jgi:hypothetical protein
VKVLLEDPDRKIRLARRRSPAAGEIPAVLLHRVMFSLPFRLYDNLPNGEDTINKSGFAYETTVYDKP